jgi:hypothetical protein
MRLPRLGCVCVAIGFVLPVGGAAQELRVVLHPFEIVGPADSALAGTLRAHLMQGLNARSRPRFFAFTDSVTALDNAGAGENVLRSVHARVSYVEGRDRVSFVVTNAGGKQHAAFDILAPRQDRHVLMRDALDRLALVLATSIRIGIAEFQRTGGDSLLYHGLQRTLPNMLLSRLGGSPHLALIELTDAERLRDLRNTGGTAVGSAGYETALELGRMRAANYVLFGDFFVLEGQLRIDVRCVSLETGEIVAMEGVVIEPVALPAIEREMARIASEIRTAVENDFVAPTNVTAPIAIAGFPPAPATFRNRRVQEALIRALREKVAALNSPLLAVREDAGLDAEIVEQRLDPWVMAARTQARYLLTLGLMRSDPDSLRITLDFHDTADLGVPVQSFRTTFIDNVDDALDQLLVQVLPTELIMADSTRPPLSSPRYRHPYPLLEVFLGFGAVRWNDSDLFLDSSGTIALEAGVGYRLRDPLQARLLLRFEPFASSGPTRRAYGGHALLGLTWDVRPRRSRSPFVGVTFGTAGILRTSESGLGYNSAAALGGYVGYRLFWARQVPWTIRLEGLSTIGSIHGQTIGGTSFPGGRPGGIYLLLNTAL